MADISPETSNSVLDLLAEWNKYLENHVPYYQNQLEERQNTGLDTFPEIER